MRLNEQQIGQIVSFVRQQCRSWLILLLGSAARGEMRADSDVDIAYIAEPEHQLSSYQRFMLAQELADLLKRDVDLIDMNESSTVFQMQIVSNGQIIYQQNLHERQLEWIQIYREYALLNEHRQQVIHLFQSEGVIPMNQDILLNKTATIRRCIQRIHEEYENNTENLYNFTRQDSIILNLQRACEACLDLAMHLISEHRLGIPQSSRDAFDLLQRGKLIDSELTRSMKAMTGFRNIAMHDYQAVQVEILEEMIEHQIPDLERFIKVVGQMQTG